MMKVIVERKIKPEKEAEIIALLIELRAKALSQRGYITGETLKSLDNPAVIITISTWNDLLQWKAWEASKERKAIADRISPLLVSPEKLSFYGLVK